MPVQLDQLKGEKSKLHKEKVDLENQLEAEQVGGTVGTPTPCSAATS